MYHRTQWTLRAAQAAIGAFLLFFAARGTSGALREGLRARTYVGASRPVGQGVAHTWVTVDRSGKPLEMGVALSQKALTGLPAGQSGMGHTGRAGMGYPMAEHVLPMPQGVSVPPFHHIVLNWNPKGHIPPHIYDVPHFDFHFYTLTPQQREKITATGADLAVVGQKPPAQFLPAGYILPPGTQEPRMGAHWIDSASVEFHNQPFEKTFIYGSYAGKLAFIEPMVTKAYLEQKPCYSAPIKQPAAFQVQGYYPTQYFVRWDPDKQEYQVGLSGFVLRRAASGPAA